MCFEHPLSSYHISLLDVDHSSESFSAIIHVLASISSSQEQLDNEALSSQAIYARLDFPDLLLFFSGAFSLIAMLGHLAFICPCFPQPKHTGLVEPESVLVYLFSLAGSSICSSSLRISETFLSAD